MRLTILNVQIRCDAAGRYSLNDLHVAAGAEARHRPGQYTRTEGFKALVAELGRGMRESAQAPVCTINDGISNGTYVVEPLVIAYAAWISPRFHLEVLNTFLAARRAESAPAGDPLAVLADPAALRHLLLGYAERVEDLQAQVAVQAPKVRALETLASADGCFSITEAAKLLQVRPRQLFAWMERNAWIYRRAQGKSWLAYQPRLQAGVLAHRAHVQRCADDVERVHEQVLVTAKGLARLGELLSRESLGWTPMDQLRAQQLAGAGR